MSRSGWQRTGKNAWTPAPDEWDAVPCPTCHAAAGQPCAPPLREGTTAHPRRVDAAVEAKRHAHYRTD